MRITAEQIDSVKFPTGRLTDGYRVGPVDDFLADVSATVADLSRENAELHAALAAHAGASSSSAEEVDALRAALADRDGRLAAMVEEVDRMRGHECPPTEQAGPVIPGAVLDLLSSASRIAGEAVDMAKVEAEALLAEARDHAGSILREANVEAEQLRNDAALDTLDRRQQALTLLGQAAEDREEAADLLERARATTEAALSSVRDQVSAAAAELAAAAASLASRADHLTVPDVGVEGMPTAAGPEPDSVQDEEAAAGSSVDDGDVENSGEPGVEPGGWADGEGTADGWASAGPALGPDVAPAAVRDGGEQVGMAAPTGPPIALPQPWHD